MKTTVAIIIFTLLCSLANAQMHKLRPDIDDLRERVDAIVYGKLIILPGQRFIIESENNEKTLTRKEFQTGVIQSPQFMDPKKVKGIANGMTNINVCVRDPENIQLDENGFGYFSLKAFPTTAVYYAHDLSFLKDDPDMKRFQRQVESGKDE